MANSALSKIQEKKILRVNSTFDGRYIPYTGGLMGWHENQGVLDHELANDYRFYTVIRSMEVRTRLFERWNSGEKISRRSSPRKKALRDQVAVEFIMNGKTIGGSLVNYSTSGMRIRLDEATHSLEKDMTPKLRIMTAAHSDEVKFEATSQIMWVNHSHQTTSTTLGVLFTDAPWKGIRELKQFLK